MLLVILKFFSIIELIVGLKDLVVDVQSPVYSGETIELLCSFDPENDTIYEIKWFKDDEEFYRASPQLSPFKISINKPGIHINLEKSDPTEDPTIRDEENNSTLFYVNKNSVYLNNVDLDTAGTYRCEVSSDANDTFQTDSQLDVVATQSNGPKLTSDQRKYKINDTVTITCSYDSRPSAELELFINNKKVDDNQTITTSSLQTNGYWSSSLTLILTIITSDEDLDVRENCGRLRIKCIANVPHFSSTISEILLIEDDSDLIEEKSFAISLSAEPVFILTYILLINTYHQLF